MKKAKLIPAIAAGVITCALSVTTGFADQAEDNHFRAYAGETGKSTGKVYYSEGHVWAKVNVAGDDLSNVTYVWKCYFDEESYKNGSYDIVNITGPVLIDRPPYYCEGKVYTCEVSDGYGNSQVVRFDMEPYQFPGLTPYNIAIPVGETLDLPAYLQDYRWDGQVFTEWESSPYDRSILEVSGNSILKGAKPGYTTIRLGTPELELGYEDPFSGYFGVQVQFKDATTESDFWYAPVYWAVQNRITEGYDDGTFRPANNCTRSQMVTFLWRMAGEPEPETTVNPFVDAMNTETYFYKAMLWGAEKGIVNGYKLKDGTQEFRPAGKCTRQQAVTFMWRYAGKPEPKTAVSPFKDIQDESTYFYKAVLWAAENGITTGYDDQTFKPIGNCLRRQMVTFLYRYDQDSVAAKINEEYFPDAAFREYVNQFDRDHNGKLEEAELNLVDEIIVSGKGIESLKGIEYFSAIYNLECSDNKLTSLDVSQNRGLKLLVCSNNQLSDLDISQNPEMYWLECNNNRLTALDVANNSQLTTLEVSNNQLSELDLHHNTKMHSVWCSNNVLEKLNIDGLSELSDLLCCRNELSSLDLSSNEILQRIFVFGNPIVTLDVSANTYLNYVSIDSDQKVTGLLVAPRVLFKINETNFPDANFRTYLQSYRMGGDYVEGFICAEEVEWIYIASCEIESLKGIEFFTNLRDLNCSDNLLTTLNLNANKSLEYLYCSDNDLTILNLSNNTELRYVYVDSGVTVTGAGDEVSINYIAPNVNHP